MTNDKEKVWLECLELIRQEVSPSQYKSFFEPIVFESFDPKTQLLILQLPNKALVEYLEGAFAPCLSRALGKMFGPSVRLSYRLQPTSGKQKKAEPEETGEPMPVASNLNPQYTFANFIEGDSNKLARSVGLSIAEHPRSSKFNPMFVYGPSGCGKTHLLNAIGLQTSALYPRKKIYYISAREFQQQYVQAQFVNNNINDFFHFYQQFDMLVVDDVQEWENSPKSAEIFFHIFNHLFMNNRRIILAADRTPSELRNMDERMLSRFACGVLTELEKPSVQLCIDILKAKIKLHDLQIPEDVVLFIAENANASVRELEGVINSLLAFSLFNNNEIDMSLAERIVSRISKETPKGCDVNQVLDTVSEYYSVDVEDILGKTRKHDIVIARQVAMYLCQQIGKMPTTRIGRLIGKRDHSTVNHSIKLVAQMIQNDKKFARQIKDLTKKLK